jgi:hypothetical protein
LKRPGAPDFVSRPSGGRRSARIIPESGGSGNMTDPELPNLTEFVTECRLFGQNWYFESFLCYYYFSYLKGEPSNGMKSA